MSVPRPVWRFEAIGTRWEVQTASPLPDDARRAADLLHASGTTTLLASIRSAPPDSLLAAAARLGALAREGLIAGIHAEGPFLSPARCGSQDPEFLRLPDPEFADLLLDASDGELVTMTFAPELPGADELVDRLILRGVVPSVGHTDAADAVAAASLAAARDEMEEAGFDGYSPRPTVTHLFSGMPPLEPGSPGAAAACLRAARNGDAVVEVVADGMRLDPAMVRTVFTLAGGDNTALVSDALGQAGWAPTLLECVRTAVAGGVPLVDAVRSATVVPADALRLADEAGALRRGLRADALVLTPDLELHAVLRLGRWLQVPKITRGNT